MKGLSNCRSAPHRAEHPEARQQKNDPCGQRYQRRRRFGGQRAGAVIAKEFIVACDRAAHLGHVNPSDQQV
jgi:hypothetical protein